MPRRLSKDKERSKAACRTLGVRLRYIAGSTKRSGVRGDWDKTMRFIEMSGAQLMSALTDNEATPEELKAAGLTDNCLVRINIHGDIEVRRAHGWDVIGGLIGEFEPRVKKAAGRDWA
jgi:hypothetical protein